MTGLDTNTRVRQLQHAITAMTHRLGNSRWYKGLADATTTHGGHADSAYWERRARWQLAAVRRLTDALAALVSDMCAHCNGTGRSFLTSARACVYCGGGGVYRCPCRGMREAL